MDCFLTDENLFFRAWATIMYSQFNRLDFISQDPTGRCSVPRWVICTADSYNGYRKDVNRAITLTLCNEEPTENSSYNFKTDPLDNNLELSMESRIQLKTSTSVCVHSLRVRRR